MAKTAMLPEVKVERKTRSTLLGKLPKASHYQLVIEGESGYRAYFQYAWGDRPKSWFVEDVLLHQNTSRWLRKAALLLGESLTASVQVNTGHPSVYGSDHYRGWTGWGVVEAEAITVPFLTVTYTASAFHKALAAA
jgi:hypothetical protein